MENKVEIIKNFQISKAFENHWLVLQNYGILNKDILRTFHRHSFLLYSRGEESIKFLYLATGASSYNLS